MPSTRAPIASERSQGFFIRGTQRLGVDRPGHGRERDTPHFPLSLRDASAWFGSASDLGTLERAELHGLARLDAVHLAALVGNAADAAVVAVGRVGTAGSAESGEERQGEHEEQQAEELSTHGGSPPFDRDGPSRGAASGAVKRKRD